MTKDLLQQELLNKVKLGIKPSDLKTSQKLNKIPVSPPPISIGNEQKPKPFKKPSPTPLKTQPEKDEGYSSSEEESNKSAPNPTISINPNKTPSSVYVLDLEQQNQALNKQLQLYKDFKEADLEIKEKQKKAIEQLNRANTNLTAGMDRLSKLNEQLSKENKELNKTIQNLKNKEKLTENIKETKTQPSYFYCDNCQQTKSGNHTKRKVDAPFEPRIHGRICYLCSACSPYVKEFAETNLKEEDNPYKFYD